MTKEDILLPVEMGKLEIEPPKVNISKIFENPFVISQEKKKLFTQKLMRYSKCTCVSQKRDITIPIYKRKTTRLIKEPILKLLHSNNDVALATLTSMRNRCVQSANTYLSESTTPITPTVQKNDTMSLHTLVDTCNQLSISSDNHVTALSLPSETFCDRKWWKKSGSMTPQIMFSRETIEDQRSSRPSALCLQETCTSGPSCSQEALNPPCDVTIDELASYFETLVHIPKKMSSMAEMMYI